MVKKILIGVVVIVVLLVIGLIAAPVIFKDEIKQSIDDQLEANINADVLYDIDNFSVSFFANFPSLTAGIHDFGIIGREPFAGEVLFAVNSFEIELNVWKLLNSEMSVKGIYLDQPEVFIKVLEDGRANYDIAISSTNEDEVAIEEESTDFNFAIEYWSIANGHIIYDDATIPTYLELTEFNHRGAGNFSLTVFDLNTTSEAHLREIRYDGANYLADRKVNLDLIMKMDLDQMKFTFMENQLAINEFAFGFDGWITMPEDDIDMDLTFKSKNNSFKSLISLIPGMYKSDFSELKTAGELKFDGAIKGRYNDNSLPAFNINLSAKDGMFQYPDLPEAVSNVQLDMLVENKDGNIDNTKIDISTFHLELGNNPVDASLIIANLVDYPIDLKASAKLNFADMMRMFPMEGMELKGLLDVKLEIDGVYDTLTSTIPASGNLNLSDFYYADKENLPQGMHIATAIASFNPENINLEAFDSKVGQSDFSATGELNNYLNYALKPHAVLGGSLNLTSNNVLVDEFMTTATTEEVSLTDTLSSSGEAYDMAVPANIDFSMNANLSKIEYDGLLLTDAKGVINIKDGILDLKDLSTRTLGGTILFNGFYDTKDPQDPKFDLDLDINDISIPGSFKAFNTVKKLAPIAENLEGKVSTELKLMGDLDHELMPVNKSINGGALLRIREATLKGGEFVTGLSKYISKGGKEEMTLENIKMEITIINGAVSVAPFDVIIEGHKSTILGSTSIDGDLNYNIATSIPAGQIGQQAKAAINQLLGNPEEASSEIKLNLKITGKYDSPKISLIGSDALKEESAKVAAQKAADLVKKNTGIEIPASKEELNKEAIEKARKEADNLLAEAQKQADQIKLEAKKTAEKVRDEAKIQNDKLIKEAGSNPLRKRGAEIAGKKLMEEADNQAKKIEEEGNKQADQVMFKAREKADTLIKNAESK